MQFIIGSVPGAILGVAADRVWRRAERRVRVRVGCFLFEDKRPEGIGFSVTSAGKAQLSPSSICLFHPLEGSWFIFPRDSEGPLMAGQETRCYCAVIPGAGGRLGVNLQDLTAKDHAEAMTDAEAEGFAFQIVMDRGAKIVSRDRALGRAAALLIATAAKRQSFQGLKPEFHVVWHAARAANRARRRQGRRTRR